MAEKFTTERRAIGRQLAKARDAHHLEQADIAASLGVSDRTVSRWERGASLPKSLAQRTAIERAYALPDGTLTDTGTHRAVSRETPPEVVRERESRYDAKGNWPEGWRARAYRLQLEAAETGATEEEIATIKGWMLDPQVQALWSGGAPKGDQLKSLDGIEVGARAWLRARGRMVKAK